MSETDVEQTDTFTCPGCLKALSLYQLFGQPCLRCEKDCKGIWFSNMQLEEVIQAVEPQESKNKPKSLSEYDTIKQDSKLNCPNDGNGMKYYFDKESLISLHHCMLCGGVWIDTQSPEAVLPLLGCIYRQQQQFAKDYVHIMMRSNQQSQSQMNDVSQEVAAQFIPWNIFGLQTLLKKVIDYFED